ncbi:thiamine pyrophosphate-requiring protein [Leucobacter sp. USHLN153]|uniref:thiamine pyrophosphate-requiring protein n=1 Tax=Leucobacter sp. USHLN153 TaxID=3081268 RepID=UPI00301A420E
MPESQEPQRTVADVIVERLSTWGVERLYGYPGDGSNPLLGALQRSDAAPRFIQARHEESAAFMAVAEAKYGGSVGVVTSTQGPGAVHLLNGLYDAKLDSVPVVAIVAQQHRSVLGSDYQQEVDLPQLFHDVAAPFVQQVNTPEQVPMVLDRAFRSALVRSQPTVVILPHDVQQADAPELGQEHGVMVTAPRWTNGTRLPHEDDLAAAAELLGAGERIAILAGRGVAHAQHEVLELAEHLDAAITTSLLGKPYVDESHALAAGTIGHLGTDASAHAMQHCDTLLIIGSNDPWSEFFPAPGQARAVQIDVDASVIGNRYPVEVGLVGNAKEAVRELLDRVPKRDRSRWRLAVEGSKRRWEQTRALRAETPAAPLNPELVVREFGSRLAPDAQLAIDVGSCVYHYARQIHLPPDVPAHLSSTLASMGCGVPYGLAAKELDPSRPVAVLAGDGGMQMLGNAELLTVADRWRGWADPRFVVLVLNNGDLSEVSWEQREMEGQPRFTPSQDLPGFSFAGYAELLGLQGVRVTEPGELAAALDEAFAADRPVVIDAATSPHVPLLPPFPGAKEKLDSMRGALEAEGDAGAEALRLLDAYVSIDKDRR